MISRFNIFRAALTSLLILTSLSSASQNLGLSTVVIDPGHGGKDPGCVSVDKKTMEKDIVLDISAKLSARIKAAYPGVNVLLTRSEDDFIELAGRAQYATQNNASLFISIHINSASGKKTSPNGYSVHILGQSTDKNKDTYAFNMDVCKRENEVILLEDDYTTTYQGFDPNDPESDIFLRLMANAYREQSLLFAQKINDNMKAGPFAKSNGIYQNNFAVLRLASMPAVLLELGFMSNPNDLAQLRKSSSIDKIVNNLFKAFSEYKSLYDESVGAAKVLPENSTSESAGKPTQANAGAISDTGGQALADAKAAADVEAGSGRDEAAADSHKTPADGKTVLSAGVCYATQVIATARTMASDDSFFLGYEPKCIDDGRLKKYFIGVSEDQDQAREMHKKIRAEHKDSFLVKIENGIPLRMSQ